ncbi:hypothetical protein D3C79_524740 [compost metagenome]
MFSSKGLGWALGGADRFERHWHTVCVQPGAELHHCDGAQYIAQKLLLAAPDKLHRPANRFGQGNGLWVGVGRVVQEVAAKEAAQQRRVQVDLCRLQAGASGNVVTEHVRGLVGQPDVEAAVRVEAGEGGRWLQLGMVQVLVVVAGLDLGLGVGQGAGNIPFVLFITGRPLHRREVFAPGVAGKIGRHRAHFAVGGRFFPVHLHRLHCTLGVPPALGDHGHGAWQLMHRMYAFHGLDLVFVAQAANRHAQARRMLHGSVEHAVDFDVDAVLGLAGGLVVGIQAAYGLSNPAKLAGVAQLDAGRVGHRQVHGATGQLTVGHGASTRGMYYVTRRG